MTKKIVVTVALLALVAACGGGGSSSSGGSTTNPTPTSSKSIGADLKAMNVVYQAFGTISGKIFPSAMVTKTTDSGSEITLTCSSTNPASFACTATDSSGGTCNVTGSANEATLLFTMTFDCTNFHPETETTIDGSFTATVTVASGAAAMTTKSTGFVKATDSGSDSGTCTIADDSSTLEGAGLSCTESGTCSADASNFIASVDVTVGSSGLKLVDVCGTYEYGAGFKIGSSFCMTAGTSDIVMNFTVNGTMNGASADFDETWTCNVGSM